MFNRSGSAVPALTILCLGVFALTTNSASAQDSEVERLRRRIEELEGKLEKVLESQSQILEKQKATPSEAVQQEPLKAPTPVPPGEELPPVAPGGPRVNLPTGTPSVDDWHVVGSDPKMYSRWYNGVQTATPQLDFLQHIRGRLLYDTGFFNHAPYNLTIPPFDDAQALRSARIGVEGIMWELMRYRAEFDFANGDGFALNVNGAVVDIKDVFLEMTRLPIVGNVRAGYFKEPFSLEWQTQQIFLTFMERSVMDRGRPVFLDPAQKQIQNFNTDLVPGRSTGVMAHNTIMDGRIYGATGWFRVDSDNQGFDNGDGDYAYTSRLTALPLWQQNGRYMIHVGGAYSYREYRDPAPGGGNLPAFNTRIATLGTPLLLNTGIIPDVDRADFYGAELAAVFGPLSFQAEYAGADLNRVHNSPALNYWGAYGYVSYFLTGENRCYNKRIAAFDRVVPKENFFCVREPGKNLGLLSGMGAWEIGLRYSIMDLRSAMSRNVDGLLPNTPTPGSLEGGTGVLRETTLGLNWYWNPNARMMWNFVHATRDNDFGFNGAVTAMMWRMQLDW